MMHAHLMMNTHHVRKTCSVDLEPTMSVFSSCQLQQVAPSLAACPLYSYLRPGQVHQLCPLHILGTT